MAERNEERVPANVKERDILAEQPASAMALGSEFVSRSEQARGE